MLANSDCTIYLYKTFTLGPNETVEGYERHYISECYLEETIGDKVTKSGQTPSNSLYLLLFNDDVVPEHPSKDIVVKGKCEFKFKNWSQEDVSDSLKEFRKKHKYRTIMSCEPMMYGGLPHLEITAR